MSAAQQGIQAAGAVINKWMKKTLEEKNIELAESLWECKQLKAENARLKQKIKALRVPA